MIHSGQTGRIKFQVYWAWGKRATLGCVKGLKSLRICALALPLGRLNFGLSMEGGKFHLFKI